MVHRIFDLYEHSPKCLYIKIMESSTEAITNHLKTECMWETTTMGGMRGTWNVKAGQNMEWKV